MGNICGKESDPFSKPGRRLDSAPTPAASASVPASVSAAGPKPAKGVGGRPRRLGGSSSDQGGGGGSADEARRKAALAAEARAQNNKGGDLSKKLAEQKKFTHRAALEEASRKNVREREMDAAADTLRHG